MYNIVRLIILICNDLAVIKSAYNFLCNSRTKPLFPAFWLDFAIKIKASNNFVQIIHEYFN